MQTHENLFIRKVYSLGDFQLAISACSFLQNYDARICHDTEELRRYKSYETMMVVSYARPFSASHAPLERLDLRSICTDLNEDEERLHKEAIELRNKVFAHSDYQKMKVNLNNFRVEGEVFFPVLRFDEQIIFKGDILAGFDLLIRKLHRTLALQVFEETQRNPELAKIAIFNN